MGITAFLLAYSFTKVYRVSGDSMSPTFKNNEIVLLKKTAIENGALVVFTPPEEWRKFSTNAEPIFFKRIAAVPGDYLEFKDDSMFLNGEKLLELPENCKNDYRGPLMLDEEIMVLGDNRASSIDSIYSWCHGEPMGISLDKIDFVGRKIL